MKLVIQQFRDVSWLKQSHNKFQVKKIVKHLSSSTYEPDIKGTEKLK